MNTPTQYRRVTVSEIDLSDNRYTLHPFPAIEPDERLRTNICTFGILHPPLLLEQNNNSFIVLSGRKRIQIAAEYRNSPITALVIDRSHIDQQQVIFSTLLQHQLIGSSLSIIEQAIFFNKAQACLPAEDLLQFLPMMGYKTKSHIPGELVSLLELDPTVQLGLHRGVLSPRAGKKLLLFASADQQVLAELINELKLGGSKQQKLIDFVLELTKRLQISAGDLLNNWQEKEKDKQHNGPQKAVSLLSWLQRKCSPRSVAEEENFTRFCQQLQLPPGVRLEHTPSFEDEQVTLKVDFSSREQLKRKWSQIKSMLQRDQDS